MGTAGVLILISGGEVGGAWFQSLLLVENYLFCAWFWLKDGATLGMRAWRLKVQTETGGKITLNQSLVRYLAGIFSLLAFGLGYLWILLDRRNRSWNDMVSNTQIIYTPKG